MLGKLIKLTLKTCIYKLHQVFVKLFALAGSTDTEETRNQYQELQIELISIRR
jgi:hypothetical protein